MKAFEDPEHEGNSSKYHTDFDCTKKDCTLPAGTWWSPYWCFKHNIELVNRISKQLEGVIDGFTNTDRSR